MKAIYLTIIVLALALGSCGGSKKNRKSSEPVYQPPPVVEIPVVKPEPIVEKPVVQPAIREVEEKLVPIAAAPVDPNSYFVIIGSFRSHDNALKYQQIILQEGFRSSLVRNAAGLYRVSVLATNDVQAARTEVRRIREKFPKYNDTWLLIQKR